MKMSDRVKIVIDNKIPMIKGVLEPFADVEYCSPFDFTKELVQDKDGLIIRTRTKCNEELLKGSSVKFIATATIGYDHIDTGYCESNNILWMNAPGCNSSSVMQYIASVIVTLAKKKNFDLKEKTLGVVGVGNVGSKVAKMAERLGLKVMLNDPPRARVEGSAGFVELEELVEKADIITFHVPLIKEGIDKTFHLADEEFFEKLKPGKVLINSSRGAVVSNRALKEAVKKGIISAVVLDVWENEPDIDRELLGLVDIATPHIAGYSADGKANGTAECVRGARRYFNLGVTPNWYPASVPLPRNQRQFTIDCTGKSDQQVLTEAVIETYDVMSDDANLRNSIETFEKQRGSYPVRREFPFYEVKAANGNKAVASVLSQLGFGIVE
jgi:erythronate-4-phosphate dehydrogenase